jgi:hypothetical protein
MVITAGTSKSYYVCGDHKKRGTCTNKLSVREDVIRTQVISEVRHRFQDYASIDYLRKRIAVLLGDQGRSTQVTIDEQSRELERTQTRCDRLISAVADGLDTPATRQAIRDFATQANRLESSIAALRAEASQPVSLPTRADVKAYLDGLDEVLARDAVAAREALHALFGGPIKLHPQVEGQYIAEGTLFPLVALAQKLAKPRGSGASWYISSCAGRI